MQKGTTSGYFWLLYFSNLLTVDQFTGFLFCIPISRCTVFFISLSFTIFSFYFFPCFPSICPTVFSKAEGRSGLGKGEGERRNSVYSPVSLPLPFTSRHVWEIEERTCKQRRWTSDHQLWIPIRIAQAFWVCLAVFQY